MTSPDWARPVVYFSIEAKDAARQRTFYSEMFNWDIGDGPVMTIPAGIGGPESGIGGHINPGTNSRISIYVQVRQIDDALAKAEELGGKVTMPKFQIPGGAMIASIEDPEGNSIGIVQQ